MAKVAEGRSPVMFAHIGTLRALHGEPQSADHDPPCVC